MEELIDKWAEILHHEDLNETKSGRISSYYQDAMQYKKFLRDCEKHSFDSDQAEDIWYMASLWANGLYNMN